MIEKLVGELRVVGSIAIEETCCVGLQGLLYRVSDGKNVTTGEETQPHEFFMKHDEVDASYINSGSGLYELTDTATGTKHKLVAIDFTL